MGSIVQLQLAILQNMSLVWFRYSCGSRITIRSKLPRQPDLRNIHGMNLLLQLLAQFLRCLALVLVKNSIAAQKSHIRLYLSSTSAASKNLLGSINQLQFSTPQNMSFVWPRYSRSSCLSFVAMMQST
jgi:hypothetical protein